MLTGKLVRWNDERGFGFIECEAGQKDIFLHISALPRASRRPIVGDTILFEQATDTNGKRKATHAVIDLMHGEYDVSISSKTTYSKIDEGARATEQTSAEWLLSPIEKSESRTSNSRPLNKLSRVNSHTIRHKEKRFGLFDKLVYLSVLIFAIFIYYKAPSMQYHANAEQPVYRLENAKPLSQFSCAGKTRCNEMISCEEAVFYLNNCPGTKMDGDGDGKPCEDWCGH
ncbi:MAG: cold shock domain-containing protein [Candidatus Methylumidiphilus sp.]